MSQKNQKIQAFKIRAIHNHVTGLGVVVGKVFADGLQLK